MIKKILFCFMLAMTFANDANAQKNYLDVTFENLSHIYWTLDVHNINDNDALDEYARIHHCDLYQSYFDNDFEWRKIREGVREEMLRNKENLSKRFYIVSTIKLDRYNFQQKAFGLREGSKLDNVGGLSLIGGNGFKKYCGLKKSVPYYPDTVGISFKQPINFKNIPMPENEANQLLSQINKVGGERSAYMFLKFRVSGFSGVEERVASNIASLTGTLEAIEIYSDYKGENLIYSSRSR